MFCFFLFLGMRWEGKETKWKKYGKAKVRRLDHPQTGSIHLTLVWFLGCRNQVLNPKGFGCSGWLLCLDFWKVELVLCLFQGIEDLQVSVCYDYRDRPVEVVSLSGSSKIDICAKYSKNGKNCLLAAS